MCRPQLLLEQHSGEAGRLQQLAALPAGMQSVPAAVPRSLAASRCLGQGEALRDQDDLSQNQLLQARGWHERPDEVHPSDPVLKSCIGVLGLVELCGEQQRHLEQ